MGGRGGEFGRCDGSLRGKCGVADERGVGGGAIGSENGGK